MATGQDLLDHLEDLFPELDLQSGEADVAQGLRALNRAQDLFETIVAQYPNVLGSDIGTVTTSASTESTAFPSTLLRVDGLDYIDSGTSRPAWPLKPIRERGGHAYYNFWPWHLTSSTNTGKPRGYWTDGSNIYWDPLPNGTHTVRWYGFASAGDITAVGTFAYPDAVILPIVTMAARIVRTGLDDPVPDYISLAEDVFGPVVAAMSRFDRAGAKGHQYRYIHST